MQIFVAVIAGLVLGYAGAQALFLGSWTLVPWGFAGLIFGVYCRKAKDAVGAGCTYGFVLVFSFLVAQYTGTVPVLQKTPGFTVLALFGSVCGIVLTVSGYVVRRWRVRIKHNGRNTVSRDDLSL